MTVIAAWADGTTVFMAADSCVEQNGTVWSAQKTVRMTTGDGKPFLLGWTGDRAAFGLVKHGLTVDLAPDPNDTEDCDQWALTIAHAITELCADATPAIVDHTSMAAQFLLAHAGRLWLLATFEAMPIDGYMAIGTGRDAALGALHAATSWGLSPEDAVNIAVEAGCAVDVNCRGPIQTVTL